MGILCEELLNDKSVLGCVFGEDVRAGGGAHAGPIGDGGAVWDGLLVCDV